MKTPTVLSLALLSALSSSAALAQTAPPRDVPFDGVLRIEVDARDIARRIFRVRETMPATAGTMTLLYPQWIPGHHSAEIPTTCTPSRWRCLPVPGRSVPNFSICHRKATARVG
jgi:hypothetical protein